VTTTSDGTIISRRLVTSSGNKAWDEAVLKAIDRTGTMPRDIDGVVPTPMLLGFKPKELL
jgi:colicin import membrane protein